MYNRQAITDLMKAISCYKRNDERVWVYLYLCATQCDCCFVRNNVCDLRNAVLGFEYVYEPYVWIAQLLSYLGYSKSGSRWFGTAMYGKTIEFDLLYRFNEEVDFELHNTSELGT